MIIGIFKGVLKKSIELGNIEGFPHLKGGKAICKNMRIAKVSIGEGAPLLPLVKQCREKHRSRPKVQHYYQASEEQLHQTQQAGNAQYPGE